jgi:glycine/D-amino acid oxidase-like deaminating enzyme
MRWYLEPHKYKTTAISYYTQHDQYDPKKNTEVYYYLTRRNFIHNKKDHTLVCIGWPEETLNKKETYHSQIPLKEQDTHNISKFLHSTYAFTPKNLDYTFSWHGLMGYTKNNIRLIWPEPKNKVLMYNLGCNGVGLLPSIFWWYKISQFLLGRVKQPSVRDPQ